MYMEGNIIILITMYGGYFCVSTCWVIGCPDVWPNMVLVVAVRAFRMRLAFESGDCIKQTAPPTMWADATQSMEGRNHQKGWPSHKGRKTSPAWLLWAGTWVLFLSSDLNWKTSSSWFLSLQLSGQNFSLRLEHHQLSCASSSPNADLGTSHPP